MKKTLAEFREYLVGWYEFLAVRFYRGLRFLEKGKSFIAEKLYQGRGRLVRPFLHTGMGGLAVIGIALAPVIANSFPVFQTSNFRETPTYPMVLSASAESGEVMSTNITEKPRAEILDYTVAAGDTISGVAGKFGISVDTILWANDLAEKAAIKPGQVIKVPPVTGIVHKVKKGDTISSLAKYYSSNKDADTVQGVTQGVVDYPFNTFANDETFELAVGQLLVIPDGAMPQKAVVPVFLARQTPNAGTVVASGQFVWPTSGRISQSFKWYHRALDVANSAGTPVLAADAGKVVVAGWPDNVGYGNRVMIDHGNGFISLYGHLAKFAVSVGQTVKRGDVIAYMGSTGRSTGPHLHFEIRAGGKTQDPMGYLK